MSLAIRPPRRSALGVTWCEDFRRGRLGVRKNQGTITEASPNFIGFRGRWINFPGNAGAVISYPRIVCTAATEITAHVWIKDPVDTTTWMSMLAQCSSVGWDANAQWFINLNLTTLQLQFCVKTTTARYTITYAAGSAAEFAGEHLITGAWKTGEPVKVYMDANLMNQSLNLAGTIIDTSQPVTVGRWADIYPYKGMLADPLVEMRQWSADEIRNYYRRSTFH